MSSFSICLWILIYSVLFECSQSRPRPQSPEIVCYELASADCQTYAQQTKQCSLWNTETTKQCICIMNACPIDVYFLLDSSNIDIYTWHNILTYLPSAFLHKCSGYNTNNYIIQYSNNEINVLANPSISQLSTLAPIPNGRYSSFCNTLYHLQDHIMSMHSNNPILLVVISGNEPHDKYKCIDVQLIPQLEHIYGIYLNDIEAETYEEILSYHQAFEINNISLSDIAILNSLLTATICEYACDISQTHSIAPTSPTLKPTARPTYFRSWGKAWFVGRWKHDKKEYDKSSRYRYRFGWNARYKRHTLYNLEQE